MDKSKPEIITIEKLNHIISSHPSGTCIAVRVTPGSSENGISGIDQWRKSLKIKLVQPAVKGKANRGLIEYLGTIFGRDHSIELIHGQTSRDKRVLIKGLVKDACLDLLADKIS